MKPEEARAIYHEARSRAMQEAHDYSKPIVQRECDLRGWAAVVEAITAEALRDIEST